MPYSFNAWHTLMQRMRVFDDLENFIILKEDTIYKL